MIFRIFNVYFFFFNFYVILDMFSTDRYSIIFFLLSYYLYYDSLLDFNYCGFIFGTCSVTARAVVTLLAFPFKGRSFWTVGILGTFLRGSGPCRTVGTLRAFGFGGSLFAIVSRSTSPILGGTPGTILARVVA